MSNVEVYVVVEGQTEQTFIREMLAPVLGCQGIYLHPVLIGKPGHKGGDIRFERAKTDIGNFLKQRANICISTMFDYFRIDPDWPGRADIRDNDTAIKKARRIEERTLSEIIKLFPNLNVSERFIPYIQMHEFEALLFSDESALANMIGANTLEIAALLNDCGEPEEINDNPQTAPSKRLQYLCGKKYRKVTMGKSIADAVGIQTMRKKCPHFDGWLKRLELLTKK
ncbi:DUF4276 family protein [Desulfonema magnum]|uniref:DUF4276 n=1 Tax=Desulfonema magnum TaxID=45655 RepID=A0A975GR59_9BACT|nr:DUF4276 family protein [Desulfonema magnum]QTA90701.1 DUF4276 [Desulfonema magnum]